MNDLKLYLLLLVFSLSGIGANSSMATRQLSAGHGRQMPVSLINNRQTKASLSTVVLTDAAQKRTALSPRSRIMPQDDKAIYGYLSYSTKPGFIPGLYILSDSEYQRVWGDPFYESTDLKLQLGFLKDNKICGYAVDVYMGYLFGMYYLEIDFNTGELLSWEELSLDNGYFLNLVYNSEDENIYGYGVNNWDEVCFMKANVNSPGNIEVVRPMDSDMDVCYSMTYNSSDGNIYGVTRNNEFVIVGSDGYSNVISTISLSDEMLPYLSGMVYVPSQDLFYWNATRWDYSTALYTISPTGDVTLVTEYANEEEFNFLITPDQPVNLEIPLKPTIKSIDYKPGELIGYVTAEMPSNLKNGSHITGDLTYTLNIDSDLTICGTAASGSIVTIPVDTPLESGYHVFNLWVSYEGYKSPQVSEKLYVGNDTPLAPTDVVLSSAAINWTPVTSDVGIHGGYVDLNNLRYVVSLNDEVLGETSESSFPINLPDAEQTAYKACVYASCNGFESAIATSNKIVEGNPFTLPLEFAPTFEEFELMTVIDSNSNHESDDFTWNQSKFWYDGDQVWIVPNSYDEVASDDYLFFPLFRIEDADKYYTWSMEAKCSASDRNDEVFTVYLANNDSNEAILYPILKLTDLTEEFQTYETIFKVPEAGTYTIALYYGSDYMQAGVYAKNFAVYDNNVVPTSPATVTDITALETAPGALKAKVYFKFPTTDLTGNELNPDQILIATIKCKNEVSVSGTPGQVVEDVEIETQQGDNTITIGISDIEGHNGLNTYVNIFTGVTIPGKVQSIDLETSADMRTVHLSWVPPTEGVNGGYINPETVNYTVYQMFDSPWGAFWEPIAEVGNETSFAYQPEEQDVVYLGVATSNEAGSTEEILYGYILAGPPYSLPFIETFEGSDYSVTDTKPWMNFVIPSDKNNARWTLKYLADHEPYLWEDRDDVALFAVTDEANADARLGMPRFSTTDLNEISLYMDVYTTSSAKVSLKGTIFGMEEPIDIDTPSIEHQESEWMPLHVSLPKELMNADWVQLYVDAYLPTTESYVGIMNIKICDDKGSNIIAATFNNQYAVGDKGMIIINSDIDAVITSASGLIIGKTTGNATLTVTPGIYLVRFSNNETCKVIVK